MWTYSNPKSGQENSEPCPIWGKDGHIWIPFKGSFLFWRSYKGCVSCGLIIRVKAEKR